MASTITLKVNDGTQIVVPDSLELITPYVLIEQQDWFEDEIKFVRRLLQPGQRVVDIGANYGVYTLSMARSVGPTGKVWAFEPASSTAGLLAQSIETNGFAHVVLEQSALSSTCGSAQLSLNNHSELNSLTRDPSPTSATQTVPLVTLDECMVRYGWQNIDFIKIDAEGEESNILEGGKRFFTELSPLVQYEIKAGADLQMALVQSFAELGYDSYRLVPGLDILIPFRCDSQPDAYLLNLFCCKQDRAGLLSDQQRLLRVSTESLDTGVSPLPHASDSPAESENYAWRNDLARLPYGAQLSSNWASTMSANGSAPLEAALSSYSRSRNIRLALRERFEALKDSFTRFRDLCERDPSHLRLASLARVAADYGTRSLAVEALSRLTNDIYASKQVDVSEPFLVPGKRFDLVSPGDAVGNWCLAAILEEYERLAAFSSFYMGKSSLPRLEAIHSLGFGSDEMKRRLLLLQKRFGLPG